MSRDQCFLLPTNTHHMVHMHKFYLHFLLFSRNANCQVIHKITFLNVVILLTIFEEICNQSSWKLTWLVLLPCQRRVQSLINIHWILHSHMLKWTNIWYIQTHIHMHTQTYSTSPQLFCIPFATSCARE